MQLSAAMMSEARDARTTLNNSPRATWERTPAPRQDDYKILTNQEEAALVRRAQSGDDRARERLVQLNIRLVYRIARRYRCRSLTLEDLAQEGIIGFLVAVDRFDLTQGCRLGTYASHWIRQSIARAIEHNDRLIRLPVQAASELRLLEQSRSQLRQELNREPNEEEIAGACSLTSERICQLMGATDPISLEALIGPDQELSLSEIAVDDNAADPEEGTLAGAGRDELRRSLRVLDERERHVILRRYGLDGNPALTLQEMSALMG